jgi:hypothetical protein
MKGEQYYSNLTRSISFSFCMPSIALYCQAKSWKSWYFAAAFENVMANSYILSAMGVYCYYGLGETFAEE